ncbi:MAG TPA: UDP-3-O-(3-hydroxymyristoyl)glucosamine N-acyltransferase [Gemmatimonadales bacterium]|nr:UDP-3-O-(3-hydroxymyristoyl)glucosamine N-acyltransferase [Gemmatimonadales bacterium]
MSGRAGRSLTAGDVAALTRGRLLGPADTPVTGVAPLDRAGPGDLSLLAATRYLPYFQRTRASVVLVAPEFESAAGPAPARVVVAEPTAALLTVLPVLFPQPVWEPGVHPTATVGRGTRWEDPVAIGAHVVLGEGVRLGRNVRIGAGCVVGDGVVLGDDVRLFPRVVCYPGAVIGNRVILHAGVVIASDGFGYVTRADPREHAKIPHVGRVVIGDDVEIGANTTVDRGSVDDTVIGPGTKIDNLVQVGHNVRIGARCLIMAQTGIAGSTHIEDDVIIAGQVGLSGHLTVGRGARLAAQAGVWGDVPAGASYSGYPARDHRSQLRKEALLNRLITIVPDLEALVRRSHESGSGR